MSSTDTTSDQSTVRQSADELDSQADELDSQAEYGVKIESATAAAVFVDEMFEVLERMVAAQRRFAQAALDEPSRQAVELAVAARAPLADLTGIAAADEVEDSDEDSDEVEESDEDEGRPAEDSQPEAASSRAEAPRQSRRRRPASTERAPESGRATTGRPRRRAEA
ncbi:hypothetical protein [Actinomycetospora sp.]|jgi:hypothetical protein|uniref:hypothetical protein n=1 Tax=Actinomycetospora sp. TaxID=1872135 RepID=UPI002F3E6C29